MSDQPTARQFERRQLISLFAALEPGAEILLEEVAAATGVDPRLDRQLIYSVTEHCRDVLGIVIKLRKDRYHRASDEELAGAVTEQRQRRVYGQAMRGIGEASAITNFAALERPAQNQLLARQAIFGNTAMMSHRDVTKRLADEVKNRALTAIDTDAVIAAARGIKQ